MTDIEILEYEINVLNTLLNRLKKNDSKLNLERIGQMTTKLRNLNIDLILKD